MKPSLIFGAFLVVKIHRQRRRKYNTHEATKSVVAGEAYREFAQGRRNPSAFVVTRTIKIFLWVSDPTRRREDKERFLRFTRGRPTFI